MWCGNRYRDMLRQFLFFLIDFYDICSLCIVMCLYAGPGCQTNDECDDGLYCNGVEYCEDGQCLSSDSIDCGFGFVCDEDTEACVADCDVFDIDGYIQCSSSFSDIELGISSIDYRLTTNETKM